MFLDLSLGGHVLAFTAVIAVLTGILGHHEVENFELRTATPPSSLVPAVQKAVSDVNKEISMDFHTLAEQVDDSLVQVRLVALLSGFFGGLGSSK